VLSGKAIGLQFETYKQKTLLTLGKYCVLWLT